MTLLYLNKFAFFTFLLCCMTSTDFVSDILIRAKITTSLLKFMVFVMTINILDFITIVIWAYEKYKPKQFEIKAKDQANQAG